MALDERSIIDRYFRPLAGEGAFDLRDDAAIFSVPTGVEIVVTTDMIAENVHFLSGDPPATVAQKALRVNLSDLAAKGAKPAGYVIGAGFGASVDEDWVAAFATGLKRDQEAFGINLLGGDTIATPGATVISITALGLVEQGRMVRRSGGRPGDALYVTGAIGLGAAGLALLKGRAGAWDSLPAKRREVLIERYRVPEPRVSFAPVVAALASAAMDISDGLVGDCDKLAAVSGCSASIEAERVPLPEGLASADNPELLGWLITAGDDYEILAAVAPEKEMQFRQAAGTAGVPVTRVGRLMAGAGPVRVTLRGKELPLKLRSYVHLGKDQA